MGKGSRRAYNKGMGLLGDQGNEMAEIFFLTLPLLLHPGPWCWRRVLRYGT